MPINANQKGGQFLLTTHDIINIIRHNSFFELSTLLYLVAIAISEHKKYTVLMVTSIPASSACLDHQCQMLVFTASVS